MRMGPSTRPTGALSSCNRQFNLPVAALFRLVIWLTSLQAQSTDGTHDTCTTTTLYPSGTTASYTREHRSDNACQPLSCTCRPRASFAQADQEEQEAEEVSRPFKSISIELQSADRLGYRNDGSSSSASKAFPTPYHFTGTDDTDALARRAARFQQSGPAQNTQSGMGLGAWFDENGASGSGSGSGLGMVPGQVGRGKMKGKGVFGYGSDEVVEVDPVSLVPAPPLSIIETSEPEAGGC